MTEAAVAPITLSARALLAIPLTEPERLFTAPDVAQREFHALAKRWHPDVNKEVGARRVYEHVAKLWEAAKERLRRGDWQTPGTLSIQTPDGKCHQWPVWCRRDFELGELHIGPSALVFTLRKEFAEFAHSGFTAIGGLQFASDAMRKEAERYLPSPSGSIVGTEADTGRPFLVCEKTETLTLLRDLPGQFGGKLDPRHVAWIVSGLLNIACYFQWAKLTHNGLSLDTCWVEPKDHTVRALGGWWYAAAVGAPLRGLTSEAYSLLPVDLRASRRADHRLDLNSIRCLAMELLAEPAKAPAPMASWLRYTSAGDAVADYRQWREVLEKSFGPRRFVEMNVSGKSIYNPEGRI